MEFLLTYGWAVVAVVTALAALSYYGVLDPVGLAIKYMPATCHIGAGLSCLDHQIYVAPPSGWPPRESNNLKLVIKNNLGYSYHITKIEILDEWGKVALLDHETGFLPRGNASAVVVDDITYHAQPPYNPIMESGTPYQKEFVITAVNDDTKLEHKFSGYIRGKVA